MLLGHRGVAAQDVVLLLVSSFVADDPVGDHEVCECIPRTPGIVSLVENRLVENEIYHRIWNVANPLHGLALFIGQPLHDSSGYEFGRGHDHSLGRNRFEFAAMHVCDLHFILFGSDRNCAGFHLHAVGVFWEKDLC